MKKGDTVILKGRVIKTQDNEDHTASLVCFEHNTDKSSRFIEYWFNDVFLTKNGGDLAEQILAIYRQRKVDDITKYVAIITLAKKLINLK